MRAMGLRIAGSGAHLPAKVVHNDQLASIMDTSDEWIRVRTGIRQRHQVEAGEYTSDLAIAAARQALVNANLEAADIDGIICATATPDYTFPASRAWCRQRWVQRQALLRFAGRLRAFTALCRPLPGSKPRVASEY